MHFNEDVLLQC